MHSDYPKYTTFALCREMLETVNLISGWRAANTLPAIQMIRRSEGLFITGEGSSRIFPAKNLMYRNLVNGNPVDVSTEGATQALDYRLDDLAVIGISNSGKTNELIRLLRVLKEKGHPSLFGITANSGTPLESFSHASLRLKCGKEEAVAATKSVVEQALVLEQIYDMVIQRVTSNCRQMAYFFGQALSMAIDPEIVGKLARSETIYFVGRNDGVAEELALKTNEIARMKSGFLEGTYCVHGIEEVLNDKESVVLIDPFEPEEKKFYDVLVKGIGMNVLAIAPKQTPFPTLVIPSYHNYQSYLSLAAGWNLLVEIGLALEIDLDRPQRARKIGNEYVEQPT